MKRVIVRYPETMSLAAALKIAARALEEGAPAWQQWTAANCPCLVERRFNTKGQSVVLHIVPTTE